MCGRFDLKCILSDFLFADDKLDTIFSDLRITARFPSNSCKERLPGSVIFKEDICSSWHILLGIIMIMQIETVR